jgi:hypothetical protein
MNVPEVKQRVKKLLRRKLEDARAEEPGRYKASVNKVDLEEEFPTLSTLAAYELTLDMVDEYWFYEGSLPRHIPTEREHWEVWFSER